MSKYARLASQWDQFSALVLAPGVSAIQRREMRRAFYAGVEAYKRIMVVAIASLDEDRGVEALEDIVTELAEFGRAIQERRA